MSKPYTNTWRLYNIQSNDEWAKEEIKGEIKSDPTYQNLWDIVKAILREEFIAMSAYVRKSERFQIKNTNDASQGP